MRFALEVWSNAWEEIERTCLVAERLGYDAFYYGESPTGLNLDCWSVLAALSRSTRTIRLGPVIANLLPTYRSLALLARQAASVALVSDGRLDFRTGAGAAKPYADPWWQPFGVEYPPYAQRLEIMDRSIPLLRSLWGGGLASLSGPGARPDVSLGFRPPPIPITVAATSPSGIACAARHADVWEASHRTPREFAELSALLDAAATGARGPIVRSLEVDVFVGRDRERATSVLSEVRAQRGDSSQHVIPRALHGTPGEVTEQISRLESAGVEQLLLAFHDPLDASALEAFADAMDSARGAPAAQESDPERGDPTSRSR